MKDTLVTSSTSSSSLEGDSRRRHHHHHHLRHPYHDGTKSMMSLSSMMKMTTTWMIATMVLMVIVLLSSVVVVNAECIASNAEFEEFFVTLNNATSIPTEGSCCQKDVCNIPCPATTPSPTVGYGISLAISIGISFFCGFLCLIFVKGEPENYFIAGKTLPLWIVSFTLAAQSIDSNALLGNVDLSYKFSIWDGMVLPIGLGLSLILNGIFLAPYLNAEPNLLTLPDLLAKRYGKVVEVLGSITSIVSYIMLLAGNLVGMGFIMAYVFSFPSNTAGIWIAASITWLYTVAGGLYGVTYTDVVQGIMGWSGCLVCVYWMIANLPEAPGISIGFPGYIYPTEEICQMYDGVPCSTNSTDLCCYNEAKWCPSPDNCRTDNGAYPYGDQRMYIGQMQNPDALSPFPNSIVWNWATIIILGVGNLAALDFQVRCIAAKTPSIARWGCIIGGLVSFAAGIPFSFVGATTRYYYGPDSIYAEFTADTCSTILGLPTCGAWVPDKQAFLKLANFQAPPVLGAWCFIGIVAASMSTADGAILAMGTVFSHNIVRQLDVKFPTLITSSNLIFAARLATIPFTIAAASIATASQKTGYLLIVAFDIMLASVVPSIVGAYYTKHPSPRAALCSYLVGVTTRIVLEFSLPKDGYLLFPFPSDEFLNYGPAASTGLPTFVYGPPSDVWNPNVEVCDQERYNDWTGIDSLTAFFLSIVAFVGVQIYEQSFNNGQPLFVIAGNVGYEKKPNHDYLSEMPLSDSITKLDTTTATKIEPEPIETKDDIDEDSDEKAPVDNDAVVDDKDAEL